VPDTEVPHGPQMIDNGRAVLLTTTAPSLDEETASRFLTLTIDESQAMTETILATQRHGDTLAGYLAELDRAAVIAKHHAAQRLLEPLVVINPFAEQLTFPAHILRARRDHKKYLMLIKAIAFLHQKQRLVKEAERGGTTFRYVEVSKSDIRRANELAARVLRASLDELSAPARNLLDVAPDDLAAVAKAAQRIANAAMQVFAADGITLQQFNESAGGQVVFHLHMHVIPRKAGVPMKPPASEKESPEVLANQALKLASALKNAS
jgi:hypothetical protein